MNSLGRRSTNDVVVQDAFASGKHAEIHCEADGIFLTYPHIEDARFFAGMGEGRMIDVWRVDVEGLDLNDLSEEGGWWICGTPISQDRLTLVEVWDTTGESQTLPLPRNKKTRRDRRIVRGSDRTGRDAS